MLIRHAMARGPYCVAPGDRCIDVLREFRQREIRHAPVTERGKLVGVLSDRDLLRALPHLVGTLDGAGGKRDAETLVCAVMSTRLITCEPSDPVDIVARALQDRRIGCMPVVSDGSLVGLVTVNDLLRCFTDHLSAPHARAITLMWTRGEKQEAPDVIALCAASGVRVTTFFESEADSGAHIYLLRVQAEGGGYGALLKACTSRGLLLMCERSAA